MIHILASVSRSPVRAGLLDACAISANFADIDCLRITRLHPHPDKNYLSSVSHKFKTGGETAVPRPSGPPASLLPVSFATLAEAMASTSPG